MRTKKVGKVFLTTSVCALSFITLAYWFVALRPLPTQFQFLNGKHVLRHGFQPPISHGPGHSSEWNLYAWNEPYGEVVDRATKELKGWKQQRSNSKDLVPFIAFSNSQQTVLIIAKELPPPGRFWSSKESPNLNSVCVFIEMPLPNTLYDEIRASTFRSEP